MKGRVKIDINYLANLARLSLSPNERKTLKKQLGETLRQINFILKAATNSVQPTVQVTQLKNVERADQEKPKLCLSQKEAFANTKNKKNGWFVVKRIKWA